MKHFLFPLFSALFAGALLADVAPGGCGKRNPGPPLPPMEETVVPAPAGTEAPPTPKP